MNTDYLKSLVHNVVQRIIDNEAEYGVEVSQLFRECRELAESIALDVYIEMVPLMVMGTDELSLRVTYTQAFLYRFMEDPKVKETRKLLAEGR